MIKFSHFALSFYILIFTFYIIKLKTKLIHPKHGHAEPIRDPRRLEALPEERLFERDRLSAGDNLPPPQGIGRNADEVNIVAAKVLVAALGYNFGKIIGVRGRDAVINKAPVKQPQR